MTDPSMRLPSAVLVIVILAATGLASAQERDPRLRRARQLYASGQQEQAREALLPLLQAEPDHVEANLLMGRIELRLGDLDAADTYLQRADDAPGRGRFLVPQTQGLVRMRRRGWNGAVEQFTEALRRAPHYTGALIARAKALAQAGRVEEALADLATVEASPEPQPAARLLAGELRLARGDMESAFQEFQTIVQLKQESTAQENAAMYIATLAETPQETRQRVLKGIGKFPDRAAPWFWLAVIDLARNDLPQARALLRLALSVNDQHAPSHVALLRTAMPGDPAPDLDTFVGPPIADIERRIAAIQALAERGDAEDAATGARNLLAQRPAFLPAQLVLVDLARRSGDPLRLLEALGDLTDVVPYLPDAHAERAVIARDLLATDLAATEVKESLALLPEDGALHYLSATILAASSDWDDALEECDRALQFGYETASLHLLRGNLYQEKQRIPEAIGELQQAVEMQPEVAESVAAFALTAMTATEPDRLVELLQQVLAARPDSPNALYALASLSLRRNEPERAAELLEHLLQVAPARSEVHYALAQAYRGSGRDAEAKEQMRRFEQLKQQEQQLWDAGNLTNQRRAEALASLAASRPQQAVELLRKVIGAPASIPHDEVLLADALLAAGQAQDAADTYARVLQSTPYDVQALCGGSAAARQLGQAERADDLQHRVAVLGSHCDSATSQ